MEVVTDIVIVGAGISGLTTSLGLHRLGYRSLVLESSDSLRTTGFALMIWTNGWKALDAVGIGDSLRQQPKLTIGGDHHEVRCLKRKALLEALEKELPSGSIRYSSKVVSIEESGYFKLVHLADGTILKTKVLIGCDGVNSVVAKWLGFKTPAFLRRSAIRGNVDIEGIQCSRPIFGNGIRAGFAPCDDKTVHWFLTFDSSSQDKEIEENPVKMKQFVVSKLGKVDDKIITIIENTELDRIIYTPLRFRHPWEPLWGNISKGSVCVAGDALHPMAPDIGQGGCSALEEGVILARCLAEALSNKSSGATKAKNEGEEYENIKVALKKYAKERRWRSFDLMCTSYVVGFIQQSGGKMISFLRDKIFPKFIAGLALKRAEFDCGKLSNS